MPKPSEQVIDEYRAAESPYGWLVEEVADYFFDDIADTDERSDAAIELIVESEDAYLELVDGTYGSDDLIACAVRITDASGANSELAVYREVPLPVVLLGICADRARVGDTVRVEQMFGDGNTAACVATWPFQMSDAVMMTNPAVRDMTASTLAEASWQRADDTDTDRRMRTARRLAAAGAAAATTVAALLVTRRRR